MSEDVAKKRFELIKASEEKKITRTVKFLTKCEDKDILRIYKEYKDKENEKLIEALTGEVVAKGALALDYFECIPDRYALERYLSKNEVCSYIAPYVPFPGLFTGAVTVGQHI